MEEQNTENLDSLKLKLKSVTKLKLVKEHELVKIRKQERLLSEELCYIKNEINNLMGQFEETKNQMLQIKKQISIIDICKKSEETKLEMYTNTLNNHKNGYEALFKKERDIIDLRNKKQKEKEAEEEELIKQKEKIIQDKNEKITQDVEALEREREAIERECIVLKKRNNAIMLKLRRKLLETENLRKKIPKQNFGTDGSVGAFKIE